MRANTKRRALVELATHMEAFLDEFDGITEFPYMPGGLVDLMAEHAFAVIEILEAGQEGLAEAGALKEEEL